MSNFKCSIFKFLPHQLILCFYVFCLCMKHKILSHFTHTLIVTFHGDGSSGILIPNLSNTSTTFLPSWLMLKLYALIPRKTQALSANFCLSKLLDHRLSCTSSQRLIIFGSNQSTSNQQSMSNFPHPIVDPMIKSCFDILKNVCC